MHIMYSKRTKYLRKNINEGMRVNLFKLQEHAQLRIPRS